MTRDEVRRALEGVRDPELDRSLVELDFVQEIALDGADVRVGLRLPTYWCAANFAYLMAADSKAAIEALPGVGSVRVELLDHFVGREVTEGVNGCLPFEEAFPNEADGSLGEVRRTFRRKAFLVRQEPVLAAARRSLGDEAVVERRLGEGRPDGVDSLQWQEYLLRRSELGMDAGPEALVFTDADGRALDVDWLANYARLSRTVRVSLEANAEFCTGLLAARFHDGLEEWQEREGVAA